MGKVYFSDSLQGRLSEQKLIENQVTFNQAVRFKNNDSYFRILKIKEKADKIYLSFACDLQNFNLEKEFEISHIIFGNESIKFINPMISKFSSYNIKINLNICTIVISEKNFWSDIKNARHKN